MRNRLLLPFQLKVKAGSSFVGWERKALLLGLFTLLFFTGVFTDNLYLLLDQVYFRLFTSLGWQAFLYQSQAGVSSLVTMRSWPTMLTYGILYTSLSFLFLHVWFKQSWKTWIAGGFYIFIFMVCSTLILTGIFIPEAEWAYKLSRRLIEMIVSPLPVILLLATLAKVR